MELDDRALPLTRGQLDIWLAQETGHSGAGWQSIRFAGVGTWNWASRNCDCR